MGSPRYACARAYRGDPRFRHLAAQWFADYVSPQPAGSLPQTTGWGACDVKPGEELWPGRPRRGSLSVVRPVWGLDLVSSRAPVPAKPRASRRPDPAMALAGGELIRCPAPPRERPVCRGEFGRLVRAGSGSVPAGAHDPGADGGDPVEVAPGVFPRERSGEAPFPGVDDQCRDASGCQCQRFGELPPSPSARHVFRHRRTCGQSWVYRRGVKCCAQIPHRPLSRRAQMV